MSIDGEFMVDSDSQNNQQSHSISPATVSADSTLLQEIESKSALGLTTSHLNARLRQQIEAYKLFRSGLATNTKNIESQTDGNNNEASSTDQLFVENVLSSAQLFKIANDASYSLLPSQLSAIREELPVELKEALEEKRRFAHRILCPPFSRFQIGLTIQERLAEQHRVKEACAESRITTLEKEQATRELSAQESIDLYLLKLRKFQQQEQENVLRFMHAARRPDASFDRNSYRKRKKQSLKEIRMLEKLERQQRQDKSRQQRQAYYDYLQSVVNMCREIQSRARMAAQKNARLARAVMQYHASVEREEQKRLERISKERLRALKADDEEAYLRLIDQQKDTRLTHLLRQTDEFLDSLTTKIRTIQAVGEQDEDIGLNIGDSADYYGTAHRISERVGEQPRMLVGGNLKDYQVKGLQWMLSLYNNHLNGILADEMGLGKTVQTISLITYLMEYKGQNGPFLVVVPLSTMTGWSLEFSRWAPFITVIEYRGAPAQRKASQQRVRSGKFNVVLTTYEYIIRDRSFLSKTRWLYVIVDEGHRMKNAHSKLSITLAQNYNTRYRLILTGTPLQNNLPELWALLNFILPSIFNSAKTFDEWFNVPFANTGERVDLNEEETLLIIRRLHKVLRPFLLRRMKKDVEGDLPEKVEITLRCPMSALQSRLYLIVAQRTATAAANGDATLANNGAAVTSIRRFNNTLMQLRKICNHPFVFEEVERQVNPGHLNNDLLYRTSGKFEVLYRILPKLKVSGHRVLIFFQMTQIMTIMEDFLNMMHLSYLRLDGSTTADERTDLLVRFNAPNSPYFVFLLSTRAGGLGLNLQTADTVILYDSDWNPHQDLQAQDRAHRIGQTKEVRIFRLLTSNSIEEYILERAQFKLGLDGKVIQAGKFDQKSTNEEREALLRAILERENADDSTLKEETEDTYKDNEELNELIARTEQEVEQFRKIDSESAVKSTKAPLIEARELPSVYLVNEQHTPTTNRQQISGDETSSVRSTRLKHVVYDETGSDVAWLKRLEQSQTSGNDSTKPTHSDAPSSKKHQGHHHHHKSPLRLKLNLTTTKPSQSKRHIPDNLELTHTHMNRVLDVMETAIDAASGRYRCDLFLQLPCSTTYPDYYAQISTPISMSEIREKISSGAYPTLLTFRSDIQLMVSNALTYNVEGSAVYEDAIELGRVAECEIERIVAELEQDHEEEQDVSNANNQLEDEEDDDDEDEEDEEDERQDSIGENNNDIDSADAYEDDESVTNADDYGDNPNSNNEDDDYMSE